MVTRPQLVPVLELRRGDRVRHRSGAWLTVRSRPRPSRTGAVVTWLYMAGGISQAGWLHQVECIRATPSQPSGEIT